MVYSLDREITGLPGRGKPGRPIVWGFSNPPSVQDLSLIDRLLAAGGATHALLLIQPAPDLLKEWMTASVVKHPFREGELYNIGNNVFMLCAIGDSGFHQCLKDAWEAYYATRIELVSGGPFWLGWWLASGQSTLKKLRRVTEGIDAPVPPAVRMACEVGFDGECLIIHLWCGDLAENHIPDIVAHL